MSKNDVEKEDDLFFGCKGKHYFPASFNVGEKWENEKKVGFYLCFPLYFTSVTTNQRSMLLFVFCCKGKMHFSIIIEMEKLWENGKNVGCQLCFYRRKTIQISIWSTFLS